MQTETLKVSGMKSEQSTAAVTQALAGIGGVQSVNVSYADASAVVVFDENKTAKSEMLTALAKAGFSSDEQRRAQAGQGSCCGGCCS